MSDAAEDIYDEEEELLEEEESTPELLELPDDAFEELPEPDNEDIPVLDQEPEETANAEEDGTEESEPVDAVDETEESEEEPEEEAPQEAAEDESLQEKFDKARQAEEEAEEDKDKDIEPEESTEIDYQAEYAKITAPFKANGKEIKVNSVDDAITLMKMGANYNKKMAGLKPNLKLMKMLSNNDLLDEEKLSYLIDLQNKNPEAITKFIKESGIDPMDIDTKKDTEYTPGTYTVNDKDIELDMVLEDIQDTPTFDKIIDVISNKWDESSKKVVLADPQLIKVINGHMEQGIYDQIAPIVESEKMLGRLTELSDLEAYKYVGDLLQKNGAFSPKTEAVAPNVPVKKKTNTRKSEDPKLKEKRKAASQPRGVPSTPMNFNPLELSDEEFEQAAGNLNI